MVVTFRELVAKAMEDADVGCGSYGTRGDWLLGLADAALAVIVSELHLSVAEMETLASVTDCDNGSVAVFGSDRFHEKVASLLGVERPMTAYQADAYRRISDSKPRHIDDRV